MLILSLPHIVGGLRVIDKAKHDKQKGPPRRNSRLASCLSLLIPMILLVLALLILRPSQTPPPITTVVVIQPTPTPPPPRWTTTPRPGLPASKIAYELDGDIYLMNADGSGKQRLTTNPLRDYDASWSPDGKSLVYWSQVENTGPPLKSQLCMVEIASGTAAILTPPEPAFDLPLWSPDGRTILFTLGNSLEQHLYRVDSDGSHLKQLTDAGFNNWYPSWSPDGQQIVFASTRDDTSGYHSIYQIYVMNADGTGQRRLIVGGNSLRPSWSPDGTHIAFWEEGNLFITDVENPAPKLLVEGGYDPQWSPDGKQIAYRAYPTGISTPQVFVIDVDGANKRQLTTKGFFQYLSWSPDSKWLVAQDTGDTRAIYRISLETGTLTMLAENKTESWTKASWQPE